jgi:hypothetical protein
MSTEVTLSFQEYKAILRNDFTSFIERTFYELNPHAIFLPGKYIDLLAAALEKCRCASPKLHPT